MIQHILRILGTNTGHVLPYLGRIRDSSYRSVNAIESLPDCFTVNPIILLADGISFAAQAVLLLVVGAWADYSEWR